MFGCPTAVAVDLSECAFANRFRPVSAAPLAAPDAVKSMPTGLVQHVSFDAGFNKCHPGFVVKK